MPLISSPKRTKRIVYSSIPLSYSIVCICVSNIFPLSLLLIQTIIESSQKEISTLVISLKALRLEFSQTFKRLSSSGPGLKIFNLNGDDEVDFGEVVWTLISICIFERDFVKFVEAVTILATAISPRGVANAFTPGFNMLVLTVASLKSRAISSYCLLSSYLTIFSESRRYSDLKKFLAEKFVNIVHRHKMLAAADKAVLDEWCYFLVEVSLKIFFFTIFLCYFHILFAINCAKSGWIGLCKIVQQWRGVADAKSSNELLFRKNPVLFWVLALLSVSLQSRVIGTSVREAHFMIQICFLPFICFERILELIVAL